MFPSHDRWKGGVYEAMPEHDEYVPWETKWNKGDSVGAARTRSEVDQEMYEFDKWMDLERLGLDAKHLEIALSERTGTNRPGDLWHTYNRNWLEASERPDSVVLMNPQAAESGEGALGGASAYISIPLDLANDFRRWLKETGKEYFYNWGKTP